MLALEAFCGQKYPQNCSNAATSNVCCITEIFHEYSQNAIISLVCVNNGFCKSCIAKKK